MLTAVMGVAVWVLSLLRVTGAVRGTNRYLHECERHGRKVNVRGADVTCPAAGRQGAGIGRCRCFASPAADFEDA